VPLPFGYVVLFLPSAPSDTDWDWAIDYLNVLSFSIRAALRTDTIAVCYHIRYMLLATVDTRPNLHSDG